MWCQSTTVQQTETVLLSLTASFPLALNHIRHRLWLKNFFDNCSHIWSVTFSVATIWILCVSVYSCNTHHLSPSFFFKFISVISSWVQQIHLDVGESRLIWLKAIWKLKSTTLSAWITSAWPSKCIRNDSGIWKPFLQALFKNTYAQSSYYE